MLLDDILISDQKLIKMGLGFSKPWYNLNEKTIKNKLGKLFHASIKLHNKDQDRLCICRLIEFERISLYTIESF